jgi:hypothetical protein
MLSHRTLADHHSHQDTFGRQFMNDIQIAVMTSGISRYE